MNHPDIKKRDLSSLVKAYSGGAPVSEAIVNQFEELTGQYIYNVYGMTETNSPSHIVPWGKRAPVDPESGALSVGVPVPNCVVKSSTPARSSSPDTGANRRKPNTPFATAFCIPAMLAKWMTTAGFMSSIAKRI
jgi:acyl-CoA synthetase (AMP-forming)/AMP-acid ligase II